MQDGSSDGLAIEMANLEDANVMVDQEFEDTDELNLELEHGEAEEFDLEVLQRRSSRSVVMIGVVALLVVAGVATAIIGLVTVFSIGAENKNPYPTVKYDANSPIDRTIEYQVTLDVQKWSNRDSALKQLQSFYTDKFDVPFGDNDTAPAKGSPEYGSWDTIRMQYTAKGDCKKSPAFSVRVRDYVWGGRKGSVTMDAKLSVETEESALVATLQPGMPFATDAFQKIEIGACRLACVLKLTYVDRHGCGSKAEKFGRETRVYWTKEESVSLDECYDLYRAYPLGFPRHEVFPNEVRLEKMQLWWLWEQYGYLIGSSGQRYRVQSSVSHLYQTLEDAIVGVVIPENQMSEWSLRVWVHPEDEPDVIEEVATVMRQIALVFGIKREQLCAQQRR